MLRRKEILLFFLASLFRVSIVLSQHHHEPDQKAVIEPQPLLAQALRLSESLSFLGSPLSPQDDRALRSLEQQPLSGATVKSISAIFDPYCLAIVSINPESRVKVERGAAVPKLMQGGWTTFLVKVLNDAGVSAALQVASGNALMPVHGSNQEPRVRSEDSISRGQVENRFLDCRMYTNRPLLANLSGLKLEYAVVQIYSKEAGQREAELSFNVGQGTQDIGFRNSINILFGISRSVKVRLRISDDDGAPTMASLRITDSRNPEVGKLSGYYPLPSRRVAAFDEYPDFFFQKQIYRRDGESVQLPPGRYHIVYSRGPEYVPGHQELSVASDKDSITASFSLKRWINLSKLGWYSADHHVHGAGCSHYDSPEEGVPPAFMIRQSLGEDLNIAAVLSWGPSWYHQKTFFTGKDDVHSLKNNIMRYDVEVSGFPSSHAGHIVLLRLREDDYPGTTRIEEWPSWTLPILRWAKAQGGVVGYAHSGWGLEPVTPTDELPNYVMPKMDNIGANEYIVTVTQGAVDFYSLGDTPPLWELNMWYHTLNCGFRPRAGGETDFPCITDERVGLSRSYFKSEGNVNYDSYVNALKAGRNYVSEGGSHIMNFAINGQEVGTKNSEINIRGRQQISISADIAAFLPADIPDSGTARLNDRVYWNIEWARKGRSRNVQVELIVDGRPVDTVTVLADGKINGIHFNYMVSQSCWAALRIMRSSHSNPIFIIDDGKPIRDMQSAQWCRKAVDQCWKMKSANMRPADREQAKIVYDQARAIYDAIIKDAQTK